MWDRVLTLETALFMIRQGEDENNIESFFELIKNNIKDYKILVVLAMMWSTMNENKQASIAVKYVGVDSASRFIILMDYLALKFKNGELK